MRSYQAIVTTLVFSFLLCSCSVEVNQTPATSLPESTPIDSSSVSWAHLGLKGKLVYLNSTTEGEALTSHVQMLDLVTGENKTLFSVSPAWIYYATVAPDAKSLVISYAPPRESDTSSARSLYVLALDGASEPQPLFPPATPADRYTQAEWSPDGTYIYYVHYNQDEQPERFYEDYDISRMTYPGGEHKKILEHAFWPRLSSDSSRIVFVSLDPETGKNELFVANADGSEARAVPLSGTQPLEIFDAPIFSPDGESILFSAPEPAQSYQPNFFERLMGIQVARAHNVPSDWWSVPANGGTPTRLTQLQTINLFASLSPDQRHMASLSGEGIFVMELDGSNLTRLVSDPAVHGTVSWIP